jgi:hypothetical protein
VSDGQDVAVGDVNLDGDPDVYVCTGGSGGTNRPDLMLLNDGSGRAFRSIPIPQTTQGWGDAVAAVPDWRGSGRAAFVVSNSKSGTRNGPTQLIAFSAP